MKKIVSILNIKLFAVVLVLFVFVFLDVTNIDRGIYKGICIPLSVSFETNCTDYYDLPIWPVLSSLGTIVALYAAWSAIRQSNRQLKVEQTPWVVVEGIIKTPSFAKVSIKNIGKGPALHITCSKSENPKDRNKPFYQDTEPHSVNMASGDEQKNWAVARSTFNNLALDNEGYIHLYIFFESQLNFLYRTDVKIKDVNQERGADCFVIMENKILELGKVENFTVKGAEI